MPSLKIKITADNKAKIEAALKAVNGTAYVHAYTSMEEVSQLVAAAEKQLSNLLPKKSWAGATWLETSGAPVAKAYSRKAFSPRAATRVALLRGSSAWYLVSATKTSVGESGGGAGRLGLTTKQTAEAVDRFREGFDTHAGV